MELSKWAQRTAQSVGNGMEKDHLAEYLQYLSNTRRLLWVNFIAGISRGLGMAVGFTILGAIAIYFLRSLAMRNLPVIGDWIAEIMRIVENHK